MNKIVLHRGTWTPDAPRYVPPLTPETIGKAFCDGRAYRSAEQHCRNAPDLHETRHYRIGESNLGLFAGIAFWFLVGIAPALCVLAIIAVAK